MSTNNPARVELALGDQAPDFSLSDAHGNSVSLADYRGQSVILYFYPRANTPGCTKEACDFQDSLTQLNDSQIQVIGISPDSPDSLLSFADKYDLTFPLLSDTKKEVLRAYGAFGEKKNYGRIVQGVIRSTFLIDPEGRIALAKYNVKATGHVARIMKELDSFLPN